MMYLSVIFIWFFLTYCSTWRKPLRLTRIDYVGNEFKTNGFYYNRSLGNFLVYVNGIYLHGGTGQESLDAITYKWTKSKFSESDFLNKTAMDWGVFQINYPSILIEHWHGGDVGTPYPTATYHGKILNDTTIVLYDWPTGQDTFYYHPMSPKPDSTNRFIK